MAYADPNDFEPVGTAVADPKDFEVVAPQANPADFEPVSSTPTTTHAPYSRTNPKPLTDEQKKAKERGAQFREVMGVQPDSILGQTPESLTALDVTNTARAGIDAQNASGIAPGHVSFRGLQKLFQAAPDTAFSEDEKLPPELNKQPIITFPTPTGDSVPAGIVRGLANTASGLSTPENIGIIATMGGAPAAVGRAAAVGFAAQMAHDLPEKISDIADSKTPGEAAEKSTEALAQALMIAGAGKHAFGRESVLPNGEVRPSGLTPEEADRAATANQLRALTPESVALTKDAQPISPEVLDGLHLAREKWVQKLRQSSPGEADKAQSEIDHIDEQLLRADKDAVAASAARVATRGQSPAPAEGEVPPVSEGAPPTKPEPTPEERQVAAHDRVTQMRNQIEVQTGDSIMADAFEKQARRAVESAIKNGNEINWSKVNDWAVKAGLKERLNAPESLNAQNDQGTTKLEATPAEQLSPAEEAAKADTIKEVNDTVSELPENLRATAKAYLDAAQSGEPDITQLAKDLGVSRETVYNHLKAMRDHFESIKEGGISLGPGAASAYEKITNTLDPTSLKRAVVDVQREVDGREGIDVPARPGSKELVSDAEDAITADPTLGKKVVDRILSKSVSDQEVSPKDAALMLIERTRLRNERAALEERTVDPDSTQAERDNARYDLSEINNQIDRIDQASRLAGTAWSDFGRLYQQVIRDDYTLESLERRAIAEKSKDGRPMSREDFQADYPEEYAKLKEQAKRVKDLEEAAKAHDAQVKENERLNGIEDAFNKFKQEADARPGIAPRVIALAESIVARLDKSADAARLRIRQRLGHAGALVDPTVVYDVGVIGASKLAHAALDFTKWSSEMIADLGDWVEPHLEEAWKHANGIWDKEEKRLGPEKASVRKVRDKNADSATKQANLVDAMKERIKDGDKFTDLGRFVQSLAREVVASGVRDRDTLVSTVMEKLKDVVPDITKEMTEDAISGYGNFKELPKGDVDVALRDLKGQLQQVGKIRDMMDKRAPQKTGVERRTPSDEERRLTKQVNELKKKGGYEVTDPATALKTSLDAIKTRLNNEIRDLDHAIATGERIRNKKGTPEYDAEAKALRDQRDAKKALYDQAFPKEPLTLEQQIERTGRALDRSIASLEEDLKTGKLYADKNAPKLSTPELEAKRAKLEALRGERQDLRDQDTARIEQDKENALVERIKTVREKILSGDTGVQGKEATVRTEKVAALQQELADLNKQLKDIRQTPERQQELAMQTYKTRTLNRIAELKEKVANKDFQPTPRKSLALDPEGTKLKADLAAVKLEIDRGREAERLQNRTRTEKILDGLVKWRRAFVLSGPKTLAKLTSAAAEILAITPAENLVGGAIGAAEKGVRAAVGGSYKTIGEQAPVHGTFNPRAEVEAVKGTWRNLFKDAADNFKTGHTDIDLIYGRPDLVPRSLLDYVGNVHAALKSPAKRNAFIRTFEGLTDYYSKNGIDVTDPAIQMKMGVEAYKEANKSVFREDNIAVNAYNRMLKALTEKDKETGRPSLVGKAAETAIKYTLPVVRIPTNIVARTFEYSFGTGIGAARIGRAVFQEGLNNLHPAEADAIMRNLKRGAVGAAVMALGYFNADKIGGYYQPGQKRDEEDVGFGKVRVFGHDVPSYLIHNPLLEQLQIGATIRRVADSKFRKKDTDPQGVAAGAFAAALGVVQEAPFLNDAELAVKLKDPNTRASALGELAKGAVPILVQQTAEAMDKDEKGNPVKRETNTGSVPSTVARSVQSVIPLARNRLPEKGIAHTRARKRR